jgi:hypothetical protein
MLFGIFFKAEKYNAIWSNISVVFFLRKNLTTVALQGCNG